jgi:hypothetical protein
VAELGEWGGGWKEEVGRRGGGAGTGSKEAGGKFSAGGGSFAGLLLGRNNHVSSSPSSNGEERHRERRRGERNSPFGLYGLGGDGVARQLTHSFLQCPVGVHRESARVYLTTANVVLAKTNSFSATYTQYPVFHHYHVHDRV